MTGNRFCQAKRTGKIERYTLMTLHATHISYTKCTDILGTSQAFKDDVL